MKIARSGPLCLTALALFTEASCQHFSLKEEAKTVKTASPIYVAVDADRLCQRIDGFGEGLPSTLVYPGLGDTLGSHRAQAIAAAVGQVRLNLGVLGLLLESPGDYSQRANDNDNPQAIEWKHFSSYGLDTLRDKFVEPARQFGFVNYFLGEEAPNVRFASPWLSDIRNRNYDQFLEETAEQVVATVTYWAKTYKQELPYYMLGDEEISGNRSLQDSKDGFGHPDPYQQMTDITKRAGMRLRSAGFVQTRFLVGSEETEEISYRLASKILADPEARRFVGAIGYHTYPYGSTYSSVKRILNTSGSGAPDPDRIAIRMRLRALAREYQVRLWQTENTNAGVPTSYDDFRARAIQIHDEFTYAEASAYFAGSAIWNATSQRLHFGNQDLHGTSSEGAVVLVDDHTGKIEITGIGYAIGHYARWITPGSARVESKSSNSLLQATAFRDDAKKRVAVVLINNAKNTNDVEIGLSGATFSGLLKGEKSAAGKYWQPIEAFAPKSSKTFSLTMPPQSAVTIAGPIDGVSTSEVQTKRNVVFN